MLNEVFIAVGTMSVSLGSRWRNRLQEKEPGVEWAEGGGLSGGSWETDPVLVLIWESGDPRGKHAAVSCHLRRHVIEDKVPLPPGTRGCYRGPSIRERPTCSHFHQCEMADFPHRAVQQVEVPRRFKEKESNRFPTQKYSAEKEKRIFRL